MKHKIEIEVISRSTKIADFFSDGIIQTKPFEIGLLFRNSGDAPLISATIKNISWSSAAGQELIYNVEKTFILDNLNPGDEKKIWIYRGGTYAHGLCKIKLNIQTANSDDIINTYQVDPFTDQVEECGPNHWIDFFFIRSREEYEQSRSNSFMEILTVVAVLVSVLALYNSNIIQGDLAHQNKQYANIMCLKDPETISITLPNGERYLCSEFENKKSD